MKSKTETFVAKQFTFGFVEYDNPRNAFVVRQVKDFELIEVEQDETLESVIDDTDLIEIMESDWFDQTAPCHWIDDMMLENGIIHIQGGKHYWRDDETIDFETEDIRDQVELPPGVFGDEVRFVFEWGVFFPLS